MVNDWDQVTIIGKQSGNTIKRYIDDDGNSIGMIKEGNLTIDDFANEYGQVNKNKVSSMRVIAGMLFFIAYLILFGYFLKEMSSFFKMVIAFGVTALHIVLEMVVAWYSNMLFLIGILAIVLIMVVSYLKELNKKSV